MGFDLPGALPRRPAGAQGTTLQTLLCRNLQSLLFFRVLQGLAGGGMVPVSQSILADAFPPEKRGQGFALFGVAVVVAPVVGPTLGGWLADNYSWHWCFLINGPVGFVALALIALILREPEAVVTTGSAHASSSGSRPCARWRSCS